MTRPTDEQLRDLAEQTNHQLSTAVARGEVAMTGMPSQITVPSVESMFQRYRTQVAHNADVVERSTHAWGLPDDVSGPWLVFMGYEYYPGGGWNDCVGEYSTWGEVVTRIKSTNDDWAQAVYGNKLVASWHNERLYPILDDHPAGKYWLRVDIE